jgi:hypothetical protein
MSCVAHDKNAKHMVDIPVWVLLAIESFIHTDSVSAISIASTLSQESDGVGFQGAQTRRLVTIWLCETMATVHAAFTVTLLGQRHVSMFHLPSAVQMFGLIKTLSEHPFERAADQLCAGLMSLCV